MLIFSLSVYKNQNVYNKRVCLCEGDGILFTKKGAMVADQGAFKYEKVLIDPNNGLLAAKLVGRIVRDVTGEYHQLMKISGTGRIYLADRAAYINVIDLEPQGHWSHLSINGRNVLAFTDACSYGVKAIGIGVFAEEGFFTSILSYKSPGASIAVTTHGTPLILKSPCNVDPDAIIAWTGPNPKFKLQLSWKNLIGQSSGESYVFSFENPGQLVLVQPSERRA